MRTNYANFAQTIITAPNSVITSLTGTVVTSDLFPASNFYAVIEQEVSWIIIKREIVKVTTRTDESFIVVRGQDWTLAQDFTTWGGTIYLSINTVAGHFNDLRDETESLGDGITANTADIATNTDDIATLDWQVETLDSDLTTLENSAVLKIWDQTVAWVKTFSSSPIVPTPTTSGQATTKGYVDWVAWIATSVVIWSRTTAWAENVVHWLWRTPKQLIVYGYVWWNTSLPFHWIRQSWNNKLIQIQNSWQTYLDQFMWYTWNPIATVTSVDATNIVLNWTWTGNTTYTIFCLG